MDNKNLYANLIEFKELTEKMINNVNEEKYDELENNLGERESCINKIKNLKYENEEFTKIAEKLCVLDLDKKLNLLMEKKKNEIKVELEKNSRWKIMNKNYNNVFYDKVKIINEKF